jgi:single stranded DNA-binding protein
VTAQLAVYGRLGQDPQQRQSQSGNPWATASIAVSLGDCDDDGTQWFGVVAFGKVAEILAKHRKGDLIGVFGRLKLNRWRDQSGQDREQLQVIADTVISAKSVRPGGGRRREG